MTPQTSETANEIARVGQMLTNEDFADFKAEFVEFKAEFADFKTEVRKRFDQIDGEFDQVGSKFDQVSERIERVLLAVVGGLFVAVAAFVGLTVL